MKRIALNSGLVLASVVFSFFLCDWILGFLGFPAKVPQRVSHPPNYEEVRQNIEYQYTFKINSRGLRYPDILDDKSPNTYRVFVSGDSFTEGVGVDDGYRFTDVLEKKFKSFRKSVLFINGGLSGTGPLRYGKLFLEVGLEYKPDALLVCVYVNDVANTPATLYPPPFETVAPENGLEKIAHALLPHLYTQLRSTHLRRRYHRRTKTTDFIKTISKLAKKRNISQVKIDQWKQSLPQDLVSAINQGTFNGMTLAYGLLYPQYWSDSIDIATTRAEQKWKNLTIILSEINKRAKLSGVQTAVVLVPCKLQYDPKSHGENDPWVVTGIETRKEWLSEETQIQKRMRIWARSEAVSLLDLTPVYRKASKSNRRLNYTLDIHWNHLGHQVAADAIASWLVDQRVFSFIEPMDSAISNSF